MKRAMALSVVLLCAGCSFPPSDNRPPEVKAAAEHLAPVRSAPSESDRVRADYLQRIVVSKIAAHRGRDALDRPKAFIQGEVKNTGDKSVDAVTVTVYFLDSNSHAVHEDTYRPVLVNSFSRDAAPLKANYARKWGCALSDVPDEWAGSVEVKVTDVEFSKAAAQ